MAQTYSEGSVLNYTTTAAVTNGALLILGNTPAVALNTATGASEVIAVATEGVFDLVRKASAGNVAMGYKAYYVTTGGVNKVTSVAASGKHIGVYAATTTTDATTCKVKLLGGPVFTAL
jgi:predicted RecA/RadA family phage recombinase